MLTPLLMHRSPTMPWKGAGRRETTTSLSFTRPSSLALSDVTSKQTPSPCLASAATLLTSLSTLPATTTFLSSPLPMYSAKELATRPAPRTRTLFCDMSVTTACLEPPWIEQVASAVGRRGTRSRTLLTTSSFLSPVTLRTACERPSVPLTDMLIISTSQALASIRSKTLLMSPLSKRCPSSSTTSPLSSASGTLLRLRSDCSLKAELLSCSMYLKLSMSSPWAVMQLFVSSTPTPPPSALPFAPRISGRRGRRASPKCFDASRGSSEGRMSTPITAMPSLLILSVTSSVRGS
mmetsp:Transcript_24668/g.49052  ORF Transcript_24668/g.49052 Transcript_24668/m.49052 type:complete len:293 (-) Transcript_24668:1328-2206(-)